MEEKRRTKTSYTGSPLTRTYYGKIRTFLRPSLSSGGHTREKWSRRPLRPERGKRAQMPKRVSSRSGELSSGPPSVTPDISASHVHPSVYLSCVLATQVLLVTRRRAVFGPLHQWRCLCASNLVRTARDKRAQRKKKAMGIGVQHRMNRNATYTCIRTTNDRSR